MSTITNVPNDPQGEYAFVGDPITAEDYRAAYRSLRVRFWDAKLRVEQLEAAAACQQTAEQLIIERREEDIEELQRQVKMLGERVQELESDPLIPTLEARIAELERQLKASASLLAGGREVVRMQRDHIEKLDALRVAVAVVVANHAGRETDYSTPPADLVTQLCEMVSANEVTP